MGPADPKAGGSPGSRPDLRGVLDLLEAQRSAGWHPGAQIYVSLRGETLLDAAVGESRPGRALEVDDLMLWYSAGKPLTAVAVLQLWERGRLGLDDPVADYVDGWGAGKERVTLRHVLTHTGGFPMAGGADPFDRDVDWATSVALTAATQAVWEPGTAAGYHPASGWRVLGAVVEAVDGRPIARYLHEEVITPSGGRHARLGIPVAEQTGYGERLVPVHWTGHVVPKLDDDGALGMVPYRIDRWHNEPWHIAKIEPGGGMRGPARDLGAFYESLLGHGPPVLDPRTVEVMGAVHRHGLKDAILGLRHPWGLGVQVEFTGGTGRRTFGHGGMASSRGLADPECGLVLVVVCNGLAGFLEAERRVLELTDAVYSALGDDVARSRKPVEQLGGGLFST